VIVKVRDKLGVSERRACKVLDQTRATQRRTLSLPSDEKQLTDDIITLATRYGRYGYRRVTALLKNEYGWRVNHKRVERIWRKEGLKVPKKQPKRSRLWLNDGSCIRLRPEYKDHVWSYDFVIDRTANGKAFKILTIIDEYTRECLGLLVKRRITSQEVIDRLFELFIIRGIPEHIRSDNGPEFTAKAIRKWLSRIGVKTLFIEPGSPWEPRYAREWSPALISFIVKNHCYTGHHAYNKATYMPNPKKPIGDITGAVKRTVRQLKAEEERVSFEVPALVTTQLWELANNNLAERGRGRGKDGKNVEALLRGRVYCPLCKRLLSVYRDSNYRHLKYYICATRSQGWKKERCHFPAFRVDWLDNLV